VGDISGFFDNVDHYILAELIQRRVADQRFIDLYWKLVKAGYVEKGVDTTPGVLGPTGLVSFVQGPTPTCLVRCLSPILSNIYLNELDRYMEDYIDKHSKTLISKVNPKIVNFSKITAHKYSETTTRDPRIFLKELKALRAQRNLRVGQPVGRSRVRTGVRIHYVRYADE